MIYVLLAVLWSSSDNSMTNVTSEFNTPQACNIAATEVRRQAEATGRVKVAVLTCVPKGEKK